jgi:hypothetical protein
MKNRVALFATATAVLGTHGFVEYQTLAENAAALADAWPKTIAGR